MNEEFVPLNTVLGSFSPPRLHMRLNGAEDEYFLEQQSIEAQATLVHEHFHFFQTILTSYGHWCWDAYRQLTGHLIGEWEKIPRKPGDKWYLPLAHQAKLGPLYAGFAAYHHFAAEEWIKQFRARSWTNRPASTLEELGLRLLRQPWQANPTVPVNGSTYTLQAHEIVEGHAYFVEASFLEIMRNVPNAIAWNQKCRPALYWVALQWFLETCGEERRAEFPIVCDLALQTSWEPVIPQSEAQWRESNPAWRFVLLSEALRDDPRLQLSSSDELKERYTSFASALLEHCGFKSLDDIFAERRSIIARRPEPMHLERIMLSGIEFRENTPWCGGNPATEPDLLNEMLTTFQVPLVEIEGELSTFGPPNPAVSQEMAVELQFQALADQLLGNCSKQSKVDGALECAFRKFGIERGCEFQKTHACSGRYRPQDGPPHPVVIEENGDMKGCYFEMLLIAMGINSSDLDIDPAAEMPAFEELSSWQPF